MCRYTTIGGSSQISPTFDELEAEMESALPASTLNQALLHKEEAGNRASFWAP